MIKVDSNDYRWGGTKITVDEEGLSALSAVVDLLKSIGVGTPIKMVQVDGGDDAKLYIEIESPEETEARHKEAEELEERIRRRREEEEASKSKAP